MKKIILLFSFIVVILISFIGNVSATTFYEGDYIPGDYIKKEKNGIKKYKQSRFIRVSNSANVAYCIEPWETLDTNVDYNEFERINNLSDFDKQKMALFAYYGYDYVDNNINHSSSKWYTIAQVLIQRQADKESDIYFTDKLNGNRITKYSDEIAELENLVNNHFIKPSFNNQSFNILKGDTITLTDANNVLEKYNIDKSNNFQLAKIDKNQISIKALDVGEEKINFTKQDNNSLDNPIIYKSPNSQDVIAKGSMINVEANINLKSFTGDIKLFKFDNDNKTCQNQGEAHLEGSIYSIYDSEYHFLKDVVIDSNCEAKFDNLEAGTYYIKEKKAGTGYEQDKITYKVTLDSNNPSKTLTLYDKVIKAKIVIHKKYGNRIRRDYKNESNALFEVLNSDNKKVSEIRTDNNGLGKIILPYGKYTIKQIEGLKNYQKSKDIHININKKTKKVITYNLFNNEKIFKLRLYKLNRYTQKLIKNNPAIFTIKNNDTNSYVLNTDNTIYFKTNNSGVLNIDNLSIGNYTIYEVKSPIGYNLNDTGINFSVSEEDIDNNNNDYIFELNYYNDKIVKAPNTNVDQEKKNNKIFLSFLLSTISLYYLLKYLTKTDVSLIL